MSMCRHLNRIWSVTHHNSDLVAETAGWLMHMTTSWPFQTKDSESVQQVLSFALTSFINMSETQNQVPGTYHALNNTTAPTTNI